MRVDNDKNNLTPNTNGEEALDRALRSLSSWTAPATKSKEEAWMQLLSRIEETESIQEELPDAPTIPIGKRFARYGMAAAALVSIILISVFFLYLTGSKQIVAPRGMVANAMLPDGSEVKLNADSKITYSKLGWDKHRIVSLQGEALFHVTKGDKFEVHTTLGFVRVLGTKFNVSVRDGRLQVDCLEGKVAVFLKDGDDQVLIGGEILTADGSSVVRAPLNPSIDVTWVHGEFFFEAAPLPEVFAELERQFNVQIHSTNISGRTYTGFFRKGNLTEALDMVCVPMGLKYTVQGNIVTIR
ncbi:MAG TPA: FecR domain-containing protein [Williamwhitmania sp.]|nr:FecR domain-containing protein [Williamwhitmania sp.]